jgi:hypothetical protein
MMPDGHWQNKCPGAKVSDEKNVKMAILLHICIIITIFNYLKNGFVPYQEWPTAIVFQTLIFPFLL